LVKPTYSKLKPLKARSVFLRHCSSLSANDGRVMEFAHSRVGNTKSVLYNTTTWRTKRKEKNNLLF
jgi:hypothetical protein